MSAPSSKVPPGHKPASEPVDLSQLPLPEPKPMFQTVRASDSVLQGLKSDGPPDSTVWDVHSRLGSNLGGTATFRLKTASLPALERRSKRMMRMTSTLTDVEEEGRETPMRPSFEERKFSRPISRTVSRTTSRASEASTRPKKYFDLIMKHHNRRVDAEAKKQRQEEKDRREGAARSAKEKAIREEERRLLRRSESDSITEASTEEEVEEQDYGVLTAYDGTMKVDIEVVVMSAPKDKREHRKGGKRRKEKRGDRHGRKDGQSGGEPGHEGGSSYTPSSSSGYSTGLSDFSIGRRSSSSSEAGSFSLQPTSSSSSSAPNLDLEAEIEALQEELGSDTSSSSGSDGLPDDLRNRQVDNIWDNPNMKWSLGIGGTVFFLPDAERYGHAPSLPPPPPQNLIGRRRLHMKPRLPLDISNHRYRDEHPNIWPEDPWSPVKDDRKRFEQKLMTLDFYTSCSRALNRLPPLERERQAAEHELRFGRMMEKETRHSEAWKAYLEKQRIKRKKEAERKAREEAAARAAAEEEQVPMQRPSLEEPMPFLTSLGML